MKSLEEDLSNPPVHRATHCVVERTLSEAGEAEQTIRDAVNNPRWSGAQLSKVLVKYGYKISASSINNHRRGVCVCRTSSEGI